MSEFCEASNSTIGHTSASLGSEFYTHVPATPIDQEFEVEASDRSASATNERARYFTVKTAVDRIITAILMVAALPLMIVVGLAIRIFDGHPVFFRQTRVGKDETVFRIWKFRTMYRNAEDATGAVWSSAPDPRVTPLGRWLRYSHLDELPQFFNVLLGDMNLIGPRPERPEFVRELAAQVPGYRERLQVRPGITGLAQLNLGYDTSLADVQHKVLFDREYIKTASFFRDARILLVTPPYVLGKLLSSWKTELGSYNNAQMPCTDNSSPRDVTMCNCRRDSASRIELEPQVAHVLNTSIISSGTAPAANPKLGPLKVHGVVRVAEVCQHPNCNEQRTPLTAFEQEKHAC